MAQNMLLGLFCFESGISYIEYLIFVFWSHFFEKIFIKIKDYYIVLKTTKYTGLRDHFEFIAFAVEKLGVWSPDARAFGKEIGKLLSDKSGDQRAGSFFRQRISLEIQRASIIGFALLIGNIITPIVMEIWGRRTAHLMTTLPITIGWLIVVTAHSAHIMILGRFLQGISMGLQGPLSYILIGEYTSPKNRGAFLTFLSLSLAIGVLFVHTTGTFLHWQHTGLISMSFTLISFMVITFSPETPSWLASKGRYDECREMFVWLRGEDEEEENDELEAMIDARQYEFKIQQHIRINGHRKAALGSFLVTLKKKEFYKPITVMIHLFTLFHFSGISVLVSYMVDIIRVIIGDHSNAYFWMIALDIQRLLANMFAIYLIKTMKRRTLLYSTGALCVGSLLSLAAYVYLKTHGLLTYDAPWIPIVLINLYMISLATGMTPMPFTIAGEIFPVAYRSMGSGISSLFRSGMYFVAVKTAPAMFAQVGIHGTFTVYAGIVAYCLAAVWFWLPETKNRTLQEIEEIFKGSPLSPQDLHSMQSLQSVN